MQILNDSEEENSVKPTLFCIWQKYHCQSLVMLLIAKAISALLEINRLSLKMRCKYTSTQGFHSLQALTEAVGVINAGLLTLR